MKLEVMRKKIDRIDRSIIKNLAMRMEIARLIGIEKKTNNLPPTDRKREKEVCKRWIREADRLGLETAFVLKICKTMIKHSKKIQI